MSRTHKPPAPAHRPVGDFDVITGPPARSRPIPPASPPKPVALEAPASPEGAGTAKPAP